MHCPTGVPGGEAGAAATAPSTFFVILVESRSLDSAMPSPRALLCFPFSAQIEVSSLIMICGFRDEMAQVEP